MALVNVHFPSRLQLEIPALKEVAAALNRIADGLKSQDDEGDSQQQIDAQTERITQSDAGLEASMEEEKKKYGNS